MSNDFSVKGDGETEQLALTNNQVFISWKLCILLFSEKAAPLSSIERSEARSKESKYVVASRWL